jgi:hypothetical protein
MIWDYERANAIYLLGEEKRIYHMDIVELPKDLLYKGIPMTYIMSECVMNKEQVFIT